MFAHTLFFSEEKSNQSNSYMDAHVHVHTGIALIKIDLWTDFGYKSTTNA